MIYGKVLTGTLYMNHSNSTLFMAVGISATLGIMMHRPGLRSIILYGLCILLMVSAMVIGEARATFVALPVLFIAFSRKARSLLLLAMSVPIFIIASYLGLDVGADTERLWNDRFLDDAPVENLRDARAIGDLDRARPALWRSALVGVYERPHVIITGVGFTNYKGLRERGPDMPRTVTTSTSTPSWSSASSALQPT